MLQATAIPTIKVCIIFETFIIGFKRRRKMRFYENQVYQILIGIRGTKLLNK